MHFNAIVLQCNDKAFFIFLMLDFTPNTVDFFSIAQNKMYLW